VLGLKQDTITGMALERGHPGRSGVLAEAERPGWPRSIRADPAFPKGCLVMH
jgi:hypothetical protein